MVPDADLALLSSLAGRSADELLALIGYAQQGKPDPEALAVILSGPLYSPLAAEGLLPKVDLNLVALRDRGRTVVERQMAEWRQALRNGLCPLYAQEHVRDMLNRLGPAGLAELLKGLHANPSVLTLAVLAYALTQSLDELCSDWQPPGGVALAGG